MSNEIRAMSALRRAALRPFGLSPQAVSGLRRAAAIAGAHHELIASILILIIAAIGCGAIWSIPA